MGEVPVWPVAACTAHRRLAGAARGADGYDGWPADELGRVAVKLRDVYGCRVGVSGMALGGDTRWAFAVLDAGLDLHAYIPFPQQADTWPQEQRDIWHGLLTAATRVVTIGSHFHKGLFFARNDAMLQASSMLVAMYDPAVAGYSGTWDTFEKAVGRKAQGALRRPVVHIDPAARHTHMCRGLRCGTGASTTPPRLASQTRIG